MRWTLARMLGLLLLSYSMATATYDFIDDSAGPSVLARGGALTAAVAEPDALFGNPAGLAGIEKWTLKTTYQTLIEIDVIKTSFTSIFPINSTTVLGISVPFQKIQHIAKTIEKNGIFIESGEMNDSKIGSIIALASAIDTTLSWGLRAKLYDIRIDTEQASGMSIDFGLVAKKLFGIINIGIVAKNIGEDTLTWSTGKQEVLSSGLDVGVDISLHDITVFYSASLSGETNPRLGVALNLFPSFLVYAGAQSQSMNQTSSYAVGCSIKLAPWLIDYAYKPTTDLGDNHYISIGFEW